MDFVFLKYSVIKKRQPMLSSASSKVVETETWLCDLACSYQIC